jgi:AcrR family transcriptional regulator
LAKRTRPTEQTGLRGHRVLDPDKREAQRQEILLAMASVVWEHGYEAATVDEVARTMGCTKGVIYYQFRSKAEIYVAMVEKVISDAIERIRAIVENGDPPEKQLRSALENLVLYGWQPMDMAAMRGQRPNSLPEEDKAYLRTLDREYNSLFIDIVTRGMESGALIRRDPRLVSLTIISACLSIFRWARPDGALAPETFAVEVPAMLLDGLIARD